MRKKVIFNIIAVLVIAVMVLVPSDISALSDDGSTVGTDGDTSNVAVKLYSKSGETSFMTGSEITLYTGVRLSGYNAEFPNTVMKVTIPKQYLAPSFNGNTGIAASTATSLAKEPEVTSDADNYYIKYSFKTMNGGDEAYIPFVFKTLNYTTPPNTTIPIKTEYYDETGKELGSQSLMITNLAQTKIYAHGDVRTFTDSKIPAQGQQATSSNPDDLDIVYSDFIVKNLDMGSGLGVYSASKYKVVLTLKNGVIYNNDWQKFLGLRDAVYDSATNTVTGTVPAPSGANDRQYNVYLKCPNWRYGASTLAFTTKITPIDAAGNEITDAALDEIPSNIIIYSKRLTKSAYVLKTEPSDYVYQDQNKDKITEWRLRTKNTSSYSASPTEPIPEGAADFYTSSVIDTLKSGHLYYDSVTIENDYTIDDPSQLENNILYGYNSSGERTEIARNLKIGEEFKIPDDNHQDPSKVYRKLEIAFPNTVKVTPGKYFFANVKTKVFPEDWEQEKEDSPRWFLSDTKDELVNERLGNTGSLRGSFSPSGPASDISSYNVSYTIDPNGTVALKSSVDRVNCMLNNIAKVTSSVNVVGTATPDGDSSYMLKNGKLYMVIPDGWEYVNNSENHTTLTYESSVKGFQTISASPEMQYDFEGTGLRALVFDIPDDIESNRDLRATINLRANSSTPQGRASVVSWLSYENNRPYEMRPSSTRTSYKYSGAADEYDLTGDGRTTDMINKASVDINFIPPEEVSGIKLVGRDLNSLTPSATSYRDLGDSFYYGFEIVNRMPSSSVAKLDLLDIFPFVGDKGIIKNKDGIYVDRDSQFRTELTGPVKFILDGQEADPESNGYEVYYSTDTPANGDFSANLGKTFKKSVSDWSKVTMIRIVSKAGTKIAPDTSLLLAAPAKIPDDADMKATAKSGDVAFNSFAYASSISEDTTFTENSYIEALKTAIPLSRYKVDGTIYRDYNYDGSLSQEEQTLKGVTVGLYNSDGQQVDKTTTDENGYYSFSVDKRGQYTVKVLDKPSDMYFHGTVTDTDDLFPASTVSTEKQKVNGKTVGNDVDINGTSQAIDLEPNSQTATVNSALEEKPISISARKEWVPDSSPVSSVDISLEALGQKKAMTLSSSENWSGTFTGLREKGPDGTVIPYILKETTQVAGFKPAISGSASDGFVLKNISTENVSVPVEKKWVGPGTDSAEITLVADGTDTDKTLELNESNLWKGTFSDLPKYDDQDGHQIVYTVREAEQANYTAAIQPTADNGFVITNTNVTKESIKVTKAWNDKDDQDGVRPDSVTVNLLANGEKVDSKTVTANDKWTCTFKDVPKYKDGKEITYTVTEDAVDHYTTEVTGSVADGFTITNSHTPEKIDVSGSKVWNDKDDQDGMRPDSITVNLLANGEKLESKTVKASDDWAWTFNDVDKYKDGKEITYTVTEDTVDHYTTDITGSVANGFTITNSHTPEKIDVSGSKTWEDADDQDGMRPDSITVNLLANGEKRESKTVKASDDWAWTFSNVDKYKDGKEITYTVEEDPVDNYETTCDGMDITNSHTPETIDVSGNKTWDDKDDQDGMRPDSITVNLLANGEKVDSKTVTANDKWAWTFKDVPKYKGGKEIKYTLTEDPVDNYTSEITGDAENGFLVTNTHVVKKTTGQVKKHKPTSGHTGTPAAKGTGTPNTPDTGDYIHLTAYLMLLTAAGLAIARALAGKKNSMEK
ncbi:MAG: Cna B-type domain-containing protein [Anaerovoracaceae bacterium]|jgi:hypothetical protein